MKQRPTASAPPSSYPREVIAADLADLIPPGVRVALESALPLLMTSLAGGILREATLVGPEARGSSPVRFPRDNRTVESLGVRGLYPIGEGAGYAGGIVSAALDGLRAAKAIIRRYAPLENGRAQPSGHTLRSD